jgi:Uma2 family endonuclease
MVQLASARWFRADDLLRPGSPEKFVEVIEGEFVQMSPAGRRHNKIAARLLLLFAAFCDRREDLDFGGDNDGFLVERDPDTLLSPDATLFSVRPEAGDGWLDFAPELAVEVLSPSNSALEMAYKKGKYFGAGTQQFWIVDPADRSLEIVFPDGRRLRWEGNATVAGEGIAQGLRVDLAELFRN